MKKERDLDSHTVTTRYLGRGLELTEIPSDFRQVVAAVISFLGQICAPQPDSAGRSFPWGLVLQA